MAYYLILISVSTSVQQGGCRLHRLELLVSEAEKRVVDLTAVVLNGTSGNTSISPAQLKVRRELRHNNHLQQRPLSCSGSGGGDGGLNNGSRGGI